MKKETTIRLGFAFPNGLFIGGLITLASAVGLTVMLFFVPNWTIVVIIPILVLVFFLSLGLLPLTSFDKVIIDPENESIHYCMSLFNYFNDRKPQSYKIFIRMILKETKRKGSVMGRFYTNHEYRLYQNDLLLYDESRKKKLLIKNVGNEKKAIKIANQISSLTGIPFINNEPKS